MHLKSSAHDKREILASWKPLLVGEHADKGFCVAKSIKTSHLSCFGLFKYTYNLSSDLLH